MTLARPRSGLHVCHMCWWLLWGTCTLAERGDRARQSQKLELDDLEADQQGTAAQRKVDTDGSSSEQLRLTTISGKTGCQIGADSITISQLDIPTEENAATRRTNCLSNAGFTNSDTVKLVVPLTSSITAHELTCTKDQDKWHCENHCTFAVQLGRSQGWFQNSGPSGKGDKWWCYIDSVRYHFHQCPDKTSAAATVPGYQVAAAAVKTCESLGYLHQFLVDGAEMSCPKTGDEQTKIFLRTVGLMTNGMSWYMEQQGFAPANEDWDEGTSLQTYCQGVADAKKATLAMVFSDPCFRNPPGGWHFRSQAQRQDFNQACQDTDTLGKCFNNLGGLSMKSLNCMKLKSLENLLFGETVDLYMHQRQAVADAIPEHHDCAYKTKALFWAATMGVWTRHTHGIARPGDGRVIKPAYPRRYCNNDNKQEAGERCSQADGERCAANHNCVSGICCKKTDGPAKAASHCCSDLEFDRAEKKCKYKQVSLGSECKVDYQCPTKAEGNKAVTLSCLTPPGKPKKICCGAKGATGKVGTKDVHRNCCSGSADTNKKCT